MTSENKKTNLVKDQKRNDGNRTLNEGEIKKSFQPEVKPITQSSIPTVNPKTIPKKK
jgi:hypothetical protein